jgi:4-amino-4-deoxychorismate lyase
VIVYLNGQYVDDSRAAVALFDGGYLFGDGVFETIRLYGGLPFDLDGHLQRMQGQLADRSSRTWSTATASPTWTAVAA